MGKKKKTHRAALFYERERNQWALGETSRSFTVRSARAWGSWQTSSRWLVIFLFSCESALHLGAEVS